LNLLFVLGVLAGFQGTLTLPGIAGLILTMGIAVDANVLIFERIREESVTGKTLAAAIDAGYTRAFTAIFDANLTAFITGVILYQFGTGPVQGFALTLMIGIVASVFSAVVISRVIIEMLLERGKVVHFG
jgi:preprotein translocase subunit SecD